MKLKSLILSSLLLACSSVALAGGPSPAEVCKIGSRGGDCDKAPSAWRAPDPRIMAYVDVQEGQSYVCSFKMTGPSNREYPNAGIRIEEPRIGEGADRGVVETSMGNQVFKEGQGERKFLVKAVKVGKDTRFLVNFVSVERHAYQLQMETYCDPVGK